MLFYRVIKRLFDICASGIALIVLSPIWLIAIIGIEVSDPGPVFYMAKRVGKDNKVFRMFKFRSMKIDKSTNEKSLRPDVDRIFFWGKVMRDTKIDELPQLLNVFNGDMSVIGPRPAAFEQVDITRTGENAVVANLVPGLSGPSALYDYIYGDQFEKEGEYNQKVLPTRLKLDLYYLTARSFRYDIKMIWFTVVCVIYRVAKKEPKKIYDELVETTKISETVDNT
ncbi:sugar transferase [Gottschalkiaceae bacterium SANA]|nr:sugar transferase [Gottschalkiaceae bacterium SANA]